VTADPEETGTPGDEEDWLGPDTSFEDEAAVDTRWPGMIRLTFVDAGGTTRTSY
jgi:hypothetical protein